ncbi:MAG: hypothetical protein ACSI46_21505 [Gloeotrichia echinulata DVL01]|jgi:hypothetical protein
MCYSDLQVNEPHFYISRKGAFAERPVGKEERNTDIEVWSKYLKTAVMQTGIEYIKFLSDYFISELA